ncbi:MAG: hypothetical protein E3J78_04655, partial [Candidatus Cloacimonadota bacterium]
MKHLFALFLLSLFISEVYAEINVYFTHSIDTSLANPNIAHGFVALDEKFINRIHQSNFSIDFCFYNIWRWNIVDSLIAAYNRGVDVRVITEHDHITNQAVQNIMNAGIPVIDDTYGNNNGDRYMHNKFAVFDFRDSSSVDDDWTWTGSYNISDYGTESNANNCIEIMNSEIARAYTLEFEEMWGSKTNTPNPDSSRFSLLKTDNTQHSFIVDSIPIELYFSPSDHSTPKIINAIATSDSTLYFCIFAFTRQDVCDAMKSMWNAGISVKGVYDEGDWLGFFSKSRDMTGDPSSNNPWNPPAPVLPDSVSSPWGPELLHHKYMIIDADCQSDPLAITGSQNWSNNGEYYNDENTLIIHSADIANQFLQEFVERYREAGGEYTACKEEGHDLEPDPEKLSICVIPNPFTLLAEIRIQLTEDRSDIGFLSSDFSIQIYDTRGTLVKTIMPSSKNFHCGADLTPGIYFITLPGFCTTKLI